MNSTPRRDVRSQELSTRHEASHIDVTRNKNGQIQKLAANPQMRFAWADTDQRKDRTMAQVANTERRYGCIAIGLHWLMAVLITTLVVLGIYMVRLPDVGFDTTKITLILLHKEIGLVVLALAGVRLGWRQVNPLPMLIASVPEWQQVAAAFVHLCFYALMLAQPVIGWLMSSASGIPVHVLGLFTLPDLLPHNEDLFGRLRQIHDWLGLAIAGIVCLHAAAALRHHFVLRDQTLRRMLRIRNRSA